jgi:hypothetical protein
VHRSPVVFITTFTGFHGCSAIAGDVYNKSHRSSPVQRLSLAGSARWAELRPGAEVRRAACRCNTQAGRHRCYRCHRCAGALSAITGWLRAVGRTSARHSKVRRAACRCNTQAGRRRCHRCTGDLRPITVGFSRAWAVGRSLKRRLYKSAVLRNRGRKVEQRTGETCSRCMSLSN